jgi:hypothetical protein
MEKNEITKQLVAIEKAICGNTGWIGTTTRELRDKIEIAAKEINNLSSQVTTSAELLDQKIADLTISINKQSDSNVILTRRMVALTALLAISTTIMAVASIVQIKTMRINSSQPSASAYNRSAVAAEP